MTGDNLHDRVRAKLSSIDTTFRASTPAAPTYGPVYQKAAVLTSFDPSALQRYTKAGESDEFYAVLADSEYSRTDSRWSLDESVRRRVFEQLRSPDVILNVLDQLVATPLDPTQRMLGHYLRNTAPPLEDQSLPELLGTLQISQWLPRPVREQIHLPEPARVQSYIERHDLLQPFKWLAGDHFSGRARELRLLREYVGVFDPSTAYTAILRSVRDVLSLYEEPPLVIHGAGGIGKSTLISRFILEHAELPQASRFPFVYIDFDRPGIIPDQPVTLLLEAVRQLGVQRPDMRDHAESIREEWHHRLQATAPQSPSSARIIESFANDFRRLLDRMSFAQEPLLFVLDTFEEVQYRGDGFVQEVGDFLNLLQRSWPRLRTVISGRAPVRNLPFTPKELALGDLDPAATQALLQSHGVATADAARKVARQVGGNPLTLCLAVELLRREQSDELRGIDTKKYFLVRLRSEQIQGQLYRRILWHVGNDNPSIRKIVHPGLVLRRLTAEIIREVLAGPCGLVDEDADELFEAMKREVSLLEPERDGALRHRPDVRRVMLRLLEADEPETVKEIHELAVEYYVRKQRDETDEQRTRIYRAEELYHRLSLGQDTATLDSRWMKKIEIDLASALEELKARERAYLAAQLGVTIDPAIRALADLETWERSTEITVRRLIGLGRFGDALAALNERQDRTAASPLHILDATVRERLGRWDEAARVLDRAVALAAETGRMSMIFELLLARARVATSLSDEASARKHLDDAMLLAETAHDNLLRLRAGLAMRRYLSSVPVDVAENLALWYRDIPDNRLESLPDTVIDATAFIPTPQMPLVAGAGSADADIVEESSVSEILLRAVRLVGMHVANGAERRNLTREILSWEQQLSKADGDTLGRLAQDVGLGSHANIAELWRRLAESQSATGLNDVMTKLLQRPDLPRGVVDAVLAIFRRTAEQRESQVSGLDAMSSGGDPTRAELELEPAHFKLLRDAVVSTYTLEGLAELINARLHRSIHSISVKDRYEDVVEDVIRYAQQNEWLSDLIAALMNARPDAPRLQGFAQAVGFASINLTDEQLQKLLEDTGCTLSADQWRARLGEFEGQVCRIEVGDRAGSGFLINPDHLLTSTGLMEPVMSGAVRPQDVVLRFDARTLSSKHGERRISKGREFRLSARWLEDSDDKTMVLNVDGTPGDQPIGSADAGFEELPRTRGWMRLFGEAPRLDAVRTLYVLAADRDAVRLVKCEDGSVRVGEDGATLYYSMPSTSDSVGAPCFDENLDLVAIHLGENKESGLEFGMSIDRTAGSAHGLQSEMLAL